MSFVFAADTHICTANFKKHRKMTGDSIFSFRQILMYARDRGLPVVLGGDVFDQARSDPACVVAYVNACEEFDANIYYITGQHDGKNTTESWPAAYRHAKPLIAGEPQEIGGALVHGASWRPEGLRDVKWAGKEDIFVGHQVWEDFNYGVPEASTGEVPEHVRLCLVGDYHVRKCIGRTHSPGSTSMMSIDEPPGKQFMVIHPQFDFGWTDVGLVTRSMLSIDFTKGESFEETLDVLASNVLGLVATGDMLPMIWCHFNVEDFEKAARVKAALSGKAHLWMKFHGAINSDTDTPAVSLEDTSTLVESIIRDALPRGEAEIAVRLWESPDISGEIEDILDSDKLEGKT